MMDNNLHLDCACTYHLHTLRFTKYEADNEVIVSAYSKQESLPDRLRSAFTYILFGKDSRIEETILNQEAVKRLKDWL